MVDFDDRRDPDAEPSSMDEMRQLRPAPRAAPHAVVEEPHPSDDELNERTLIAPSPFEDAEYPGLDEPVTMPADDVQTRIPVAQVPTARPAAGRRPSFPDQMPRPEMMEGHSVRIVTAPIAAAPLPQRRSASARQQHRLYLALAFIAGLTGGLAFLAILYTVLVG